MPIAQEVYGDCDHKWPRVGGLCCGCERQVDKKPSFWIKAFGITVILVKIVFWVYLCVWLLGRV